MTVTLNSSPLVLATLQNLSGPRTGNGMARSLSRLKASTSEVRAFGGLDLQIQRSGKAAPSKVRYGAITITPRAQGSAFSRSPGVNTVVDRAYDNPGVRFGDHVRGRGRPISAAGETSCHFSQTSVSKTSPIREMISAARSGRRRTGSKAAAHVEYIERDGAPEKIDKYELLYGARFTAEMERRAADRSASAQQDYIERAGAAEGIERDPSRRITDEDLDELEEASFGTIGKTVEERRRFWHAVEAAEASPKGDRITIKPGDNPAWWAKAVDAIDRAPATAQRELKDARARADGEPFELKLPTDKAFALHQWAISLDDEAPIEVSPGRGGRTQTRVIAELPYELDGRERLQVVRDFTDKLAEKGFPFWAVVHAPDQNNDARNYHVHIAYYDRPSQRMKTASGKEVWDFEIQEERRYPNRTNYLVRPHQQNRLRETNNQDWIAELRGHWETVTNAVLKDAGHMKRYNLGTYESMGISLEPQKHINPKTFNKERKGELTDEGPILARRQWDAEQENVLRDHQHQAARRFRKINALADQARAGMERHPRGELTKTIVERLRERGLEASMAKAKADLLRDLGRVVMDRVMSRPKLILIEAAKQDDKHKRKSALADDAVPDDRLLPTARIFGTETRNELAELVVDLSDQAIHLDTEHSRLVQIANSRLRDVFQELSAWAEKPMQPVTPHHMLGLQSSRPMDPVELERQRKVRIAAIQAGFMQELKKTLPEFLETASRRTMPDTNDKRATAEAPSPVRKTQNPTQTLQTDAGPETLDGGSVPPSSPARRDTATPLNLEALGQAHGAPSPHIHSDRRPPSPRMTSPMAAIGTGHSTTGRWSDGRPNFPSGRVDTRPASGTRQGRMGTGAPGLRGDRVSAGNTHAGDVALPPAARPDVEPGCRMLTPHPIHSLPEPSEFDASRAKGGVPSVTPRDVASVASRGAEAAPVREGAGPTLRTVSTEPVAPASPVAGTSTREGRPQAIASAPSAQIPQSPPFAPESARVTEPSNGEREAGVEPSTTSVTEAVVSSSPSSSGVPKVPRTTPRYLMREVPAVAATDPDKPPAENAVREKPELAETADRTTEDDNFRPDDIEIVGALSPPKKQLPRQRQRIRDYDRER